MTRPILIGMEVELDQATGEIKRFVETSDRGARKVGQSLQQAGQAAEQAARTTVPAQQRLTTSSNSMATSFQGAGAAVSAAAAAVQTMGVQGGPITTLASSLSALAVSGTGPLALVVAGVTALSLAFAEFSADSGPIDRTQEKLEGLRKTTSDLLLELRGLESGLGTNRQRLEEELELARNRVNARLNGPILGNLDAPDRAFTGEIRGASGGVRALESEFERLGRELSRRVDRSPQELERLMRRRTVVSELLREQRENLRNEEKILAQLEKQLDTLEKLRREREAQSEQQKKQSDALREGFEFANPGAFGSLLGGSFPQTLARFAAERNAQGGRIGIGPGRQVPVPPVDALGLSQAFLDDRDARERERQLGPFSEAPDYARFAAERQSEARAAMDAMEAQRRELESRFRSSGLSLAEGMKDGLSRLLSGELDDPLLALTQLVSRSFSDAVAEGVIEGLGVRSAAASITEGISNFLSGGLGGKTSSGTKLTGIESGIDIAFPELAGLEAASVPGKREYIVVQTDAPDSVAAKLSQNGARAIVAKALGNDGGAGSIPARRR